MFMVFCSFVRSGERAEPKPAEQGALCQKKAHKSPYPPQKGFVAVVVWFKLKGRAPPPAGVRASGYSISCKLFRGQASKHTKRGQMLTYASGAWPDPHIQINTTHARRGRCLYHSVYETSLRPSFEAFPE